MIKGRTCPDCGRSAKTGSAFTRHINRCPVAMGLSSRRRVRDPQEIEGEEGNAQDLRARKRRFGEGRSVAELVSLTPRPLISGADFWQPVAHEPCPPSWDEVIPAAVQSGGEDHLSEDIPGLNQGPRTVTSVGSLRVATFAEECGRAAGQPLDRYPHRDPYL